MTELPPGFVLDQQSARQTTTLPPGFALDNRGISDKLLGVGGERVQLWPERIARAVGHAILSGVTLPRDVIVDAQNQPPPGTMSDSDVGPLTPSRVTDLSGLGMPVNPAVRAGDKAIPGASRNLVQQKPAVPTATQLDEIATEGYNVVRGMGVELRPELAQQLGLTMERALGERFPDTATAGTFEILRRLQNVPSGEGGRVFLPFSQLDNARQQLRAIAGDFTKPVDQAAAQQAIQWLDSVMAKMPESAVVAGPAAQAREILTKSRDDYAAAQRSNKITGELDSAYTGVADRAELRAAAANSGQNVDNALRQRVASLLSNKKELAGFNAEEIAAMEQVVKGTASANTLRFVGNLLGGGGGLGMAVTAGMGALAGLASGNPAVGALAALPALGYALKSFGNRVTKGEVAKLDDLIRTRSPLYQERLANAPMIPANPLPNEMMLRALLGGVIGPQTPAVP